MKRKLLSIILTLGIIAGLFTGCSGKAETVSDNSIKEENKTAEIAVETKASTEETSKTEEKEDESQPEPIVLRSSFAQGMTGAVNNFAIEKGFYKELGIEFENIQVNTGNAGVLSLLTRGEIDVADGDPSSYIPGIYNGVPAKLVGNMWRYSGCYWLVANNDIKSFEDLKGKTIGTQGSAGGMRLSVLKMLEKNNIREDEVTLVANGAYQDAYATLQSGEVDATIIHNPYAILAEEDGIGHSLGRAWDYIPDYYTGTLIASNDIIENHPDKLQRFVTAYYQVHEKVKHEYFDEFIQWAAEKMNTSPETMRKAVEAEIDVWRDYPVIPVDRLETTFQYLKEYGWVEEGVDYSDTFTNEFATVAAETLGLTDPEKK
jgi:NitT/TauT family transport system substrate-binding protein